MLVAIALALLAAPSWADQEREVVVLELEGTIQPASLRYVDRGLAEGASAELIILELDTPGGLLVSLRQMTTSIAASPAPVAVHVTPGGAQAASAGFFLLLASDVAAMAPGTNAGAAHPVVLGTGSAPEDEEAKGSTQALEKVTEDMAALARSLAEAHGRPAQWAERAVRESRSYSAEEALDLGLVEVIAADREELLEALDGRTVQRADGQRVTLDLASARVEVVAWGFGERVLAVIAEPQVAYLLLMIGLVGLAIEALHPGGVAPGVMGALCVALAFYGLSVLPVSGAGVVLIVLGIGLIVAEAFATTYGLLALAGAASLAFGSLMLIDTPIPAWRLGPGIVIPVVALLLVTTLFLATRATRASRTPTTTGAEGMVGEIGELTEGIPTADADGRVFVHGEYWTATSPAALPEGARVRIDRVVGPRLVVSSVPPP